MSYFFATGAFICHAALAFWPAYPIALCHFSFFGRRMLSPLAIAHHPPSTFGRRILSPLATLHFWLAYSIVHCHLSFSDRRILSPIAPFQFWQAYPIAHRPFSLLAGAFGTPRDSHNLAGTLTVDCCMLRRHHCFSFSRHDLMPCYLAAVPPSIHPITSITTPASISIISFILGSSSDYGWHLCVRRGMPRQGHLTDCIPFLQS